MSLSSPGSIVDASARPLGISRRWSPKSATQTFRMTFQMAGLLAGLLPALTELGVDGAVLILISAEMARYMVPVWGKRRQGLGFARQDIALSFIFVLLPLAFRELTMLAGLTGGISAWQAQMEFLDVR